MSAVVIDTHILLWYLFDATKLSPDDLMHIPRAVVPELPDRVIAATAFC